MTRFLPNPEGVEPSCRSCAVDLPLSHDGFCNACARRISTVALPRNGVTFYFAVVRFDDRAPAFLVEVCVENEEDASLAYESLELPDLEEEAAAFWKSPAIRARVLHDAGVTPSARARETMEVPR